MRKTVLYFFVLIALVSLAISSCTGESNKIQKESELNPVVISEPQIDEFSDLRQVRLNRDHKSLKDLDLTNEYDALLTAKFDTLTIWPSKDKMPEKFDPQEIIQMGKDPGLGIRDLHNQGITGKGVNVAIIDQPLLLEHEEYKDKINKYTMIECEDARPQMHGPAVASIMVGKSCGVAPGASLYYWAEPSWEADYKYGTTALDQIIEYNKNKPLDERIRVVSVSIGYDSNFPNWEMWEKKIEEAEKNGIIVVHCADYGEEIFFGVGCSLYKDRNNPENYDICYFARSYADLESKKYLYVPIDNRTVASYVGEKEYTFGAQGGLSWGAPYLAGVIALGYQIDPNLKSKDIYKYLRETGTTFNGGCIINPKAFIEKVKEAK